MKKLLIIAVSVFMTLVFASKAHAGTDISRLVRLESVMAEQGDDGERVTLKFAKDWRSKPRPSFYPKSIQMDVEGAYISPAKREFKLKGKLFTSATVSQVAANTVRVRLFMKGDPRNYSGNWTGSASGDKMILDIFKDRSAMESENLAAKSIKEKEAAAPAPVVKETPLAKSEAPAMAEKAVESVNESASKPAASAAVSHASAIVEDKSVKSFGFLAKPALAAEKSAVWSAQGTAPGTTQGTGQNSGKSFLNYEDPKVPEAPSMTGMAVKMVASLALVLSLVFALSWVAKKYMGKFGGAFGSGGVVKILASGSIGMKKQIAVVDVAGEVIVLGISGDNITMLTTIEDQESADRLRRGSGTGTSGSVGGGMGMSGGPKANSPAGALQKALEALRIGKVKTAPEIPPAIIDEEDPDTFAGSLAGITGRQVADKYASARTGRIEVKGEEESRISREDLLKKVTGAIKARNGSMRLA
ncbi:MAG: FliO/MopB family protein [Nitrospinae bacterium]|nr:FliO/MopB family protein [Nitrospinota bacterium]